MQHNAKHDYTRRQNEIVRCIYLTLYNKFEINKSKNALNYKAIANENAETRFSIRIKTDILIKNNRP